MVWFSEMLSTSSSHLRLQLLSISLDFTLVPWDLWLQGFKDLAPRVYFYQWRKSLHSCFHTIKVTGIIGAIKSPFNEGEELELGMTRKVLTQLLMGSVLTFQHSHDWDRTIMQDDKWNNLGTPVPAYTAWEIPTPEQTLYFDTMGIGTL